MGKIAITMGDPSGVGPEIIVSLLSGLNNDQLNELVIIGNSQILNGPCSVGLNFICFKIIVACILNETTLVDFRKQTTKPCAWWTKFAMNFLQT